MITHVLYYEMVYKLYHLEVYDSWHSKYEVWPSLQMDVLDNIIYTRDNQEPMYV